MSIRLSSLPCALALAAAVVALAPPARAAGPGDAVEKPMKSLISAVRYGKDELALKMLDGEAQGRALLGDDWAKATPAQREEFSALFHKLFAGIAFPKIRENLKNLATTLYEPAAVTGEAATCRSTIVIDHPLKKQELGVEWALRKAAKEGWRVVDVTVLGTGGASMLADIRKDQIVPLMAKGGWDGLLGAMRQRAEAIEKAAAK
jgi:phospholipid transport system substrate-binding protein